MCIRFPAESTIHGEIIHCHDYANANVVSFPQKRDYHQLKSANVHNILHTICMSELNILFISITTRNVRCSKLISRDPFQFHDYSNANVTGFLQKKNLIITSCEHRNVRNRLHIIISQIYILFSIVTWYARRCKLISCYIFQH